MRTLSLVLVSALAGLWGWYAAEVAPAAGGPPVAVAERQDAPRPSAESLNNTGVSLDRAGRHGEALLHLERAHSFRPLDPVIAENLASVRARAEKRAWIHVLVPVSALVGLLLFGGWLWRLFRGLFDRVRLARLRLRGDPWIRIRPRDERADLKLRFTEPVAPLLRRHPLTIVWSCASQGKHMKSRPPVAADGRKCVVTLDGERLQRLRRHPGDWKGFLYVGRTAVGEAAARVG